MMFGIKFLQIENSRIIAEGGVSIWANSHGDAWEMARRLYAGHDVRLYVEPMVAFLPPGPITRRAIKRGKAFILGGKVLPGWTE